MAADDCPLQKGRNSPPGDGTWLFLTAVLGVIVLLVSIGPTLVWSVNDRAPKNDFISFYTAGRLLSRGKLYDRAKTAEEHAKLGVRPDQHSMVCLRIPFYATLLEPLGRLRYRHAYLLWQILSVAAFLVSAFLWKPSFGGIVAPGAAWNVPMAFALVRGQDSAFLLLIVSLGVWLLRRQRCVAAGLVLSLCALKWSIFLTLPLLFFARRAWRTAIAFAGGASVIAILCFASGGATWYSEYLQTILAPFSAPHPEEMASLNGLFAGLPHPALLELAAAVGVLGIAWAGMRKSASFEHAVAATLVSGILVSHHAYLYDCLLLFPAALTGARSRSKPLRALGILMLSPVFFGSLLFPPFSRLAQAGLLVFLALNALYASPLRFLKREPDEDPAAATTAVPIRSLAGPAGRESDRDSSPDPHGRHAGDR